MTESESSWYVPDWTLPPGVRALQTLRCGGSSCGPWQGFNLGDHVGDSAQAVRRHRALLAAELGIRPRWLQQVHGVGVCDLNLAAEAVIEADAAVLRCEGSDRQACAIMTADCLPVLFSAEDGSVVAAAHAGWRGLLAGVLEAAVKAMRTPGENVLVWLGPAIGPKAFEVGEEVRDAFVGHSAKAAEAFVPSLTGGRWYADLFLLARQRLQAIGVEHIQGGGECTYTDAARYYSYRRDGVTGRMASLIWLESQK